MRSLSLVLCLIFTTLLLTGCANPWSNPNYEGSKKVREYHFDKDSTDCSVLASDKFPLDKRKQRAFYDACMDEKGWKESRQGEGYYYNN